MHLQEWKPSNFRLSKQEHADWVRWMALRDQVLAKLEDARREKVIGKSLEAKVTIQLSFDEVNSLENNHTVIMITVWLFSKLFTSSNESWMVTFASSDLPITFSRRASSSLANT